MNIITVIIHSLKRFHGEVNFRDNDFFHFDFSMVFFLSNSLLFSSFDEIPLRMSSMTTRVFLKNCHLFCTVQKNKNKDVIYFLL